MQKISDERKVQKTCYLINILLHGFMQNFLKTLQHVSNHKNLEIKPREKAMKKTITTIKAD